MILQKLRRPNIDSFIGPRFINFSGKCEFDIKSVWSPFISF